MKEQCSLLNIFQLNMHRSKASMAGFANWNGKFEEEFVYCVQEPNTYKGKVTGVPRNISVYQKQETGKRVRAAVMTSAGINSWFLPDYSTPDVCTVLLKDAIVVNNTPNNIIVCSVYLDINDTVVIPEVVVKLLEKAKSDNVRLIMCLDTNGHSPLWGSNSNKRGEKIEEIIFSYGLQVENKGSKPTFFGRGTATSIDVTLTYNCQGLIHDWQTLDKVDSLSDHYIIKLMVKNSVLGYTQHEVRRVNWAKFQSTLSHCRFYDVPETIDSKWLDMEADFIAEKIMKTARLACIQEKSCKDNGRSLVKPGYWSEEINSIKRESRRLLRWAKEDNTEVAWSNFRNKRDEFKKAVAKAKKAHWRKGLSEMKDPKAMSKLLKSLHSGKKQEIQITSDRQDIGSPGKTVDHFLDVLFPGSKPYTGDIEVSTKPNCQIKATFLAESRLNFVSTDKIKYFINQFNIGKAAGLDRIKPIMLTKLPGNFIQRLETLYKASLLLEYVPRSWRQANVVLIPKNGKKDYSEPKSFRPISLTSFIFKILEKIVKDEIEQKYLSLKPLNEHQHAFRSGKSCESALAEVVDAIESSMLRGEASIGVFLDISGAFDNLLPEAACLGMRKKGIPENIIAWYRHYLTCRNICVQIKGVNKERLVEKGTPQGGVLSPLVWNMAFDGLLEEGNKGPVRVVGFADDACLVVSGPDPGTLVTIAQEAVTRIVSWGASAGLAFNAKKTAVMLFTNRRKIPKLRKIKIDGTEVDYVNSTKYLGIELDSKLKFTEHVKCKVIKAKRLLMSLRNAIGKLWGPSPKLIKWAYTCVVRPMISYGAYVWGHRAANLEAELVKIQRLAILATTYIPRSAPTKGLEVIYGWMPLHLHVRMMGSRSSFRINGAFRSGWNGIGRGSMRSTLFKWKKILRELNIDKAFPDRVNLGPIFERAFSVSKSDNRYNLDLKDQWCCISAFPMEGGINWGFHMAHKNEFISDRGFLPDCNSILEGELIALKSCLKCTIGDDDLMIITKQVNLGGLLLRKKQCSKLVYEVTNTLNSKGKKGSIQIVTLTKETELEQISDLKNELKQLKGPKCESVTIGPAQVKECTLRSVLAEWNVSWRKEVTCRQTKRFWPMVDLTASKNVFSLNREELSWVVQTLTGHGFNKYHLKVSMGTDDVLCRYCNSAVEDTWHVVNECPKFDLIRTGFFKLGKGWTPQDVQGLPGFLREANCGDLFRPLGVD